MHNLLILAGNPNYYNKISFTELFNVDKLIVQINMTGIFITDN